MQTVTVTLLGSYYGVGGSGSTVATGSATLTFDSTQTLRCMSVTASNVNLPDGTQLHVDLSSNALFQPTAYYPVWATQSAGSLTLVGGIASESISTADGLSVPLFGTDRTDRHHRVFGRGRQPRHRAERQLQPPRQGQ